MRSILLHIRDDDCMEARFQVALDMARQFDGHLTCVQAVPFQYGVPNDFYGTMTPQLIDTLRQAADEQREQMEKRLSVEDVRWDWVTSDGWPNSVLARQAPHHDLIVLGAHQFSTDANTPSALVSDLVFDVCAPVLVVPAETKALPLDSPATVAWNGSAQAAHALRAALPMLARASEVHILTADESRDKGRMALSSAEAAKYLSRHGIEPNVVELHPEAGLSIADSLRSAALARKAAYMVMGAYGHTRLRERIFGGVTRDMLGKPGIPLLLSH